MELGAFTPFLWLLKVREWCWDILERETGARMTHSFGRIGGMAKPPTPKFKESVRELLVEVKTVGPFSRSRVHDPLLYYGLPQLARLRRTLGLWLQDSRSRSMAPHWTDLSVDLCTVDQRQAPPLIRHVRSILPPEDF